ncbi:MAG TPA: right-handed parallel beta-helix repeat-containing protein [Gaiella sp.]
MSPSRRARLALLALVSLLLVSSDAVAGTHRAAGSSALRVSGAAGFESAVRALRARGGTIVLRPRLYREIVVRWRTGKPLRIIGTPGARIERLIFDRASQVTVGNVTIGPIGGDALVDVRASRDIVLQDLVVTARGTRFSSAVRIPDSREVTIRRSDFSHCGDRSPRFTFCVLLWRWSHRVTIEGNRFHDCRGCDFVHGRFGSHLTIRGNRFERALPCRGLGAYRCGHQDLVQLFAGRHLRVERNHFGVYREGGAQLYLTNNVDHATIVNNVFLGTDRRVPGYRARMGIIVGSAASKRLPHFVRVVNNTILTGARRRDGYEGSIRMSSKYGSVLRRKRPIVANNVIALLAKRRHICSAALVFAHNVVIDGTGCSSSDRVGPANLDPIGRPRRLSDVVDAAMRLYAPRTDSTGRRRIGKPDIGALEYRR